MTAEEWNAISKLLRRIQVTVGILALMIFGFYALVIVGMPAQRTRDVQMARVLEAMDRLKGRDQESLKDRTYIHESLGRLREAMERLEVEKKPGGP